MSERIDFSGNGISTPRPIQSLQSLLISFIFFLEAELLHLFFFLLQLEQGHTAVSPLPDGRPVRSCSLGLGWAYTLCS